MRRNERGGLIMRGFVDRKTEIDVWLAARRARETGPLERQLRTLMNHARRRAETAGAPPPEVARIRLAMRALGAWRRGRFRDAGGWETGTYHFVVASWLLLDRKSATVSFGEPSVIHILQRPGANGFKAAR